MENDRKVVVVEKLRLLDERSKKRDDRVSIFNLFYFSGNL